MTERDTVPLEPFSGMMRLQAAHAAGDALVAIALAGTLFFSVPVGEARERVGLYLLLTMAPFALLSPLIGPLLDRRGSYRFALAFASGTRCVLAIYMATRTDRLLMYPLAFGILVASRAHGVARSSFVPETLPPGRALVWANARLSIVSVVAGAAALLPGAGLQRIGPGWTLRAAAVVFALGAVTALGLPKPPKRDARRDRVEGSVRALLEPLLLAGGLATAGSRAALGFTVFVLAFVLRAQGHGAGGFVTVLVGAGLGSLTGSVVAPALKRAMPELAMVFLSIAAMSIVAFASANGFGLAAAFVVSAVTGFGTQTARLAFDSLIQRDAPEALRARTFARYETIFQACWVTGSLVAVSIPFGAAAGLVVLGLISAGTIVVSLLALPRPANRAKS